MEFPTEGKDKHSRSASAWPARPSGSCRPGRRWIPPARRPTTRTGSAGPTASGSCAAAASCAAAPTSGPRRFRPVHRMLSGLRFQASRLNAARRIEVELQSEREGRLPRGGILELE